MKKQPKVSLRKQLATAKEDAGMSWECLEMIRETLAFFLPMDGCPPMMYNDAIRNLVGRERREASQMTRESFSEGFQMGCRAKRWFANAADRSHGTQWNLSYSKRAAEANETRTDTECGGPPRRDQPRHD